MEMERLTLIAAAAEWSRDGTARDIRKRAGVSLRDVAAVVGVGESAVSRWETGIRHPRGDAAVSWVRLLVLLKGATKAAAR